jgi:hypothetical protein
LHSFEKMLAIMKQASSGKTSVTIGTSVRYTWWVLADCAQDGMVEILSMANALGLSSLIPRKHNMRESVGRVK